MLRDQVVQRLHLPSAGFLQYRVELVPDGFYVLATYSRKGYQGVEVLQEAILHCSFEDIMGYRSTRVILYPVRAFNLSLPALLHQPITAEEGVKIINNWIFSHSPRNRVF